MYRAARDAGINFFDTADQYSKGRSEEILGALMRGHRDELIIATKCFNPGAATSTPAAARAGTSGAPWRRASSACRLTGWKFSIYTIRRAHSIEESMRALEDLVRAGVLLYRPEQPSGLADAAGARCAGAPRLGAPAVFSRCTTW